nr:tetratricopeptide repeat protein [Desulfobaculum xiamenense]
MLTARGEAAYARGRAAEAVAFLRRALDINPYSADALTDMAVILAGQGRRDEAATLLRRALDAVPDHRDARQSLAALGIARHEAAEGAS